MRNAAMRRPCRKHVGAGGLITADMRFVVVRQGVTSSEPQPQVSARRSIQSMKVRGCRRTVAFFCHGTCCVHVGVGDWIEIAAAGQLQSPIPVRE